MPLFSIPQFLLLMSVLHLTNGTPVRRDITFTDAEAAFNTLQQWYNQSTGIWNPSTGWWNSANCVTVISDLALIDSNMRLVTEDVLSNTYTQAQQYNMQTTKVVGKFDQNWLVESFYGEPQQMTGQSTGFLNNYYDDEGWWALGWIAAYDLTGNQRYLSQAETIFADMQAVWGQTNCSINSEATGGIWWDKSKTYINAIANELHISVAAHLANRVPSKCATYLSIALQQWSWFQGSGMINADNLINDGLSTNCENNNGTVWSYNQGVILGGLTELSRATNDSSYLTIAQQIADAAIASLAPGGILVESCEPDCGADGPQFKGIFVRNLSMLQRADPQSRYADFLARNAESVWSRDRNERNELGLSWTGPFLDPANAAAHSSAMDVLVADLAVR